MCEDVLLKFILSETNIPTIVPTGTRWDPYFTSTNKYSKVEREDDNGPYVLKSVKMIVTVETHLTLPVRQE